MPMRKLTEPQRALGGASHVRRDRDCRDGRGLCDPLWLNAYRFMLPFEFELEFDLRFELDFRFEFMFMFEFIFELLSIFAFPFAFPPDIPPWSVALIERAICRWLCRVGSVLAAQAFTSASVAFCD